MSEEPPPKPARICVFCGASVGTTEIYMEAARALAQTFHKNGVEMVYGGGSTGLMGELASTLVSLSGPGAVHGVIPRPLLLQERIGHVTEQEPESQPEPEPEPAPPSESTKVTATASSISISDPSGATATASSASVSAESSTPALKAPKESAYGRTTIVSSMHERKQLMTKLVLEGGPGSGFIALPGGFGTLEELAEVTTWNQIGIHELGIVLFDVAGFWQPLLQWIKHATEQGFIVEKNAGIVATAPDAEGCLKALREYRVSEARAKLNWT